MNNIQTMEVDVHIVPFTPEEYLDYPSRMWDKAPATLDQVEDDKTVEPSLAPQSTVIHISQGVYRKVATGIIEQIGQQQQLCSVEVVYNNGAFEGVLSARLIIYRREEVAPDGVFDFVSDIIPTWWEFNTTLSGDDSCTLNDFEFEQVRRYIY